jgi:hypothetical protein
MKECGTRSDTQRADLSAGTLGKPGSIHTVAPESLRSRDKARSARIDQGFPCAV